MRKPLLALLLLFAATAAAAAGLQNIGLTTENFISPLGIEQSAPRLSWRIETNAHGVIQQAYEIEVASSLEKLAAGEADLWRSGVVRSNNSLYIPYSGSPLRPNKRYYWRVRSHTNIGIAPWSKSAHWGMGLFDDADWKGQWIGLDRPMPWDQEIAISRLSARYLRQEFTCHKTIRQATLHISGLGLYELFINGQRIGDQVLAPAPTDYRKTILYNSFDVTQSIQKENAIGVILGNGRYYTMRQNYKPYKIPNFGYPKMRLHLAIEYSDGTSETIVSNDKWRLNADGPIRSNNEYDGEEYDARREFGRWTETGFDDSAWIKAQRVAIPDGTLRSAPSENMKVVKKINPKELKPVPSDPNRYIVDMGQNFAGWLRIRIKGTTGDSIRLRFAEQLQPNGELYVENLRDARSTDLYIVSGKEKPNATWAPVFVYHGFRFAEITLSASGIQYNANDLIGEVVSDEMESTGTFECSNPTLNQLFTNAWWGILGNYKGMPVDCPQRNERQPWLGDRTLGSLGESYLFGNEALYAKWMDDIRESQREEGAIPDVAPAYWNYYSDNVTWPAAFFFVGEMLYSQYGNLEPIRKNYPAMRRWLNYIYRRYQASNGLITADKYGDWCVPPESLEMIHSRDSSRRTDGTLIASAYYYKLLLMSARFARLQGVETDAVEYLQRAEKLKSDFRKAFWNEKQGYFSNNTVTANLLPLAFGIVSTDEEERVFGQIVETILTKNKGHISTGVIGIQWLMRELSKRGRADIAFLLATNRTYPSWGYMIEQGATTIWELWNGNTASPKMNSGNHVMLLGDLLTWYYEHIAGIRPSSPGFATFDLHPNFEIDNLSFVNASYRTPYGKITSHWRKEHGSLHWTIEVPANTTANLYLPLPDKKAITDKAFRFLRREGNNGIWQVGSGKYTINVKLNPTLGAFRQGIEIDEFLYETAPFPECHGATITEAANGTLVASFFGGTKEARPDCNIYVCRKDPNQKGWSAPIEVANGILPTGERKACWNPVLFTAPSGEILLFYKVGKRVSDWSGYIIRSNDNGATWSRPELLPEKALGPIKNKPILVGDKILAPSSTEGEGGWRVRMEQYNTDGSSAKVLPYIAAENAPLTWDPQSNTTFDAEAGEESKRPESTIQAIQATLLRHPNGKIQILCRTRNGAMGEAWSDDNGTTWTPLTLSTLPSNNSGFDGVTLQDGRSLLVYNHYRTRMGTKKGPRTPLNVALSRDGKKWDASLILESSPISQYSYPSVIQSKDGSVHIVYTWRRQRIKYVRIDPKKLKTEKISSWKE